jgi:hypothetical protein
MLQEHFFLDLQPAAYFLKFFLKNAFSLSKEKLSLHPHLEINDNGSVAQLDRASDYGSEGLWFESIQGH